jgi:hypothetical protein
MTEFLIFISAVGIVFFLGLHSLSVNSGHKILAAVNSLVIGTFNLFLLKSVPDIHTWQATAAYLLGGPVGITLAIYTHPFIAKVLYNR